MNIMADKIQAIWPEILLVAAACLCMLVGLAKSVSVRRLTFWIALLALAGTVPMMYLTPAMNLGFTMLPRVMIAGMGVLLLLVARDVPDDLTLTRAEESGDPSVAFDPGNVMRGEFTGFFLLSLAGAMLAVGATDLVWLFLALELTSLPTYVMVATSRDKAVAQESAVKYFFLGAMAAAVFLYGFTLIYGATGFTDFEHIKDTAAAQLRTGNLSPILLAGVILSVVGIAFKIAAFPMHFYVADVYQGATTPVTAFLAFVPKAAGFLSIIAILSLVHWPLPEPIYWTLWGMAALTMTTGNVLGLMQKSVKRTLAYSSVAHTGYMLVGLVAGLPKLGEDRDLAMGNGIAAIYFYLLAYGFSTVAAFAVLGCLRSRGEEADTYDDISGLAKRHPALASILLLAVLSLLGLPPAIGFVGKLYLFGTAIDHATPQNWLIPLVIIGVLNSAIAAVYYLRIVSAMFFGDPAEEVTARPFSTRHFAAALAAVAAIVLGPLAGPLVKLTRNSAIDAMPIPRHVHPAAVTDNVPPKPDAAG